MKPFANDSDSLGIGADLTVENGSDRISIYGSISITRDQVGLADARTLLTILQKAVAVMEADAKLPAKIQDKPTTQSPNPFA